MAEEESDLIVREKPLTDWKQEPTLRELKQDALEAQPAHDASTTQIKTWLDNLNVTGSAKPKTQKNASAVQPKLIRKQAEWRYAALSEPFLADPNIFKVSPVTWEDVDAARQNELLLNNQFNTKLDKVGFIDEYVRTAVDEGTVILRLGWDFQEEKYTEERPEIRYFVDPAFAPVIQQIGELKAQNPQQFYALPEPLQQAFEMSLEQGEPVKPEPTGEMETVELSRTLKNQPTLEVCNFRNVTIDPTCEGDLKKANFIIYEFDASLSTLKKDGRYKNLDNINLENSSVLAEPDYADEQQAAKNFTFSDEARKRFVVREYWGFRDLDGSGVVRPFVAAWVGDTKIRMEENPFPDEELPFVKVQYLPRRKEIYGEPDGSLLEDNQRIIGAVTRGVIDLMGKSANAQQGIRKDALDTINRRRFESGKDYEFNPQVGDVRSALIMHEYPEVPRSAQYMIDLQNMEAESITGVKAFSGGLSGDALGKVATGVRGVLDAASKREIGILRRLSQGMIEVARKFIAMNQEFLSEEETVRVTNDEFVQVRRDDLGGSFDLKLSISTAEDDNAKAEELAFMLQTIGPDEDPKLRRQILSEIMRLRKMPDMAKTIEDYQPEPDPAQEEIQMLTIEKLKKEIAKLDSEAIENIGNARLHGARAQTEGAKTGKLVSEIDQANLDFVEQESGVKQERDLQKIGEQAESQAQLKILDRAFEREDQLNETLKEQVEKFQVE